MLERKHAKQWHPSTFADHGLENLEIYIWTGPLLIHFCSVIVFNIIIVTIHLRLLIVVNRLCC